MKRNTSPSSSGAGELFSKKASFIQHSLPGLGAGAYRLQVQQELRDSSDNLITISDLATVTRQFGVKGPKYSLDANVVESVYPPAASVGGFSTALAHVVLNHEKLPWLRSPYLPQHVVPLGEHEYQADGRTIRYDDDQPTWMTVLTLSPSDIDGRDPLALITRGTVLDLVPATLKMVDKNGALVAGKLPAGGYSIFSYLLQPPTSNSPVSPDSPVSPEFGNTAADPCQYIDVPVAVFNMLAPSMADLKLMAHVRAVEMEAKPLRQDETVLPVQQYGLVLGNRLPETFTDGDEVSGTAPGHNVAFVVSLECMELALRGSQAAQNQYPVITGSSGFVRLVVLHQWSFTSWANKSYLFEHFLKGLNGRDPQAGNSTAPLPNPLFRLPNPPQFSAPTPAQTVVQQMLELGYTPLNHLTRTPDATASPPLIQTVSWYRGPFIPLAQEATLRFGAAPPGTLIQTVYSADKLLRFDPAVGMYDASYAAAWQLGRLTALQNKSFSVPYFRWQKASAQKFRTLLENALLRDSHPGLLARSRGLATAENSTDSEKTIYQSVLDLLTKQD